jgi:hypothetical protein
MLYVAVALVLVAGLLAFFGFGVIAAYSWDDDEPFGRDDNTR